MTARSQSADLLKGTAVLFMIQVHILELFSSPYTYNSSLGKASLFLGAAPVAPLFMVILGYFIVSTGKTTTQQIIRGIKIFCLGMLLNILLNLNLILSVNKDVYQIDLLPYIFGVDILQFAGISIIVIALLKKVFEKYLYFIILCIFLSAFLGQFLLNYIPENVALKYISAAFYGSVKWSYFPLFPWLSYPLTGIAFYYLNQRYDLMKLLEGKIKLVFGALFLLFLVFTIKYGISVSADLPLYYHHGVLFFVWAITFLFFYVFFIDKINRSLGGTVLFKYVKWMGENVTIIYVIQWVVIGNVATEIYKTISSPMVLLACFLVVVIVSSGITYLGVKLKEHLTKKI